MALCLTLNSASFKLDFKVENDNFFKIKVDEFKEKVVLNNLIFNKFLKDLFIDEQNFDSNPK